VERGCECANGIESNPFDDNSNESELSHRLDAAWGRAEPCRAEQPTPPFAVRPFAPHCPCVARICLLITHSISSVPLHPRSRSAANRPEHRVGSVRTERTGSASGSGGGWVSVSLIVTTPVMHAHRDQAHTATQRQQRQWRSSAVTIGKQQQPQQWATGDGKGNQRAAAKWLAARSSFAFGESSRSPRSR